MGRSPQYIQPTARSYTMRAVLVFGLVAVASGLPQAPADAPRPAPPVWFLETSLDSGSFSERSARCGELSPGKATSDGPIFIPEDQNAWICINFPPRTLSDGRQLKGGWRHDKGNKGICVNGCCEFQPPTKAKPKAVDHPNWFEPVTDCSNPTTINDAPLLFKGSNGDAKQVCIEDPETGDYRLDSGALANCGGECCIFYKNA